MQRQPSGGHIAQEVRSPTEPLDGNFTINYLLHFLVETLPPLDSELPTFVNSDLGGPAYQTGDRR
jgi:hypothetical protein